MFRTTKKTNDKNTTAKVIARRRRGQGMTEYIVIVGLIALVLVGAVRGFKDALKGAFERSTKEVQEQVTAQIGKP